MPDRLSTLLHEVDQLPTALAAPQRVREHGLRLRRRRQAAVTTGALGVVAAAALGLAALSGGGATLEPPPVVPASAGPTSAPTTAPTAAPPVEGADGLVRDGHDLGFLGPITDGPDGPTLVLDRAVVLSGEEANAEAEARGWESPVPNDVLVLNDNPRLREYVVSPDAEVFLTVGLTGAEPTDGPVESSLDELRRLLPPPSDEPTSGYLFDIVVEDGVVVSLTHVYVP